MAKKKRKGKQGDLETALARLLANSGNGMNANPGWLGRLGQVRPNEQFLLGALLGAAAVYVLSDEELRGRLMKSGLNLYASLMGGLEELKEQAADLRAEVDVERGQTP